VGVCFFILINFLFSLPSTSEPYGSGLSHHIEATQNELEQFKDILNGYNSFVDANALLGVSLIIELLLNNIR
jgi:hypothetical protein